MKKILILFFLAACGSEKDEPKPIEEPSRTELLTATQWELISVGGEDPIAPLTYEFKTDGTIRYDRKEFGSGGGEWLLLNDNQTLHLSLTSGGTYDYPIVRLTEKELVYKDDQNKDNLFHAL